MGAELCLAHDIGGWRHRGPPFGRHAALRLFHSTISSGHSPWTPYVKSNPKFVPPLNWTENLHVFLVKLSVADCSCYEQVQSPCY